MLSARAGEECRRFEGLEAGGAEDLLVTFSARELLAFGSEQPELGKENCGAKGPRNSSWRGESRTSELRENDEGLWRSRFDERKRVEEALRETEERTNELCTLRWANGGGGEVNSRRAG